MEVLPSKTDQILVVDDEESLRLTFESFLSAAGYGPVLGVASYDEAMSVIQEHDFDLIISDIVLGGASGIDLLRRIKEMGKKCPVVMITGYPHVDTAIEAIHLGAFDYLSKPVKKDALLRVTDLALKHHSEEQNRMSDKKSYPQVFPELKAGSHLEETGHILIIDDEENLRLTLEFFLNRAGLGSVVGVSSYDEAMSAIELYDFDLIISDIVLEGALGTDLLKQMKQLGINCPMVMITGYPHVDTAAEAVRLGAFDYLAKPVKKDALLRVAVSALEQHALQKEKDCFEAEKENQRFYRETILRSIREIIITVDTRFRIVCMNDMALEWTKSYSPEITVGATLQESENPITKIFLNDAEHILSTREEIKEHRIEWQRPDGSPGILSVTAAPLIDDHGIFLGIILSSRDITHIERIENYEYRSQFNGLIGRSAAMQEIYALIESISPVDTAVLISGETGTGKELLAKTLHNNSSRSERPFVMIDCTGKHEDILESELFGQSRNTGESEGKTHLGCILQADGGTLYLNEVADISPRMQLRLLRFLQDGTFYPVNRNQPIQADVRVIASTSADLNEKVRVGSFREDVFYRLRVIDIMLPALRNRPEDIPILAAHFLNGKQKNGEKRVDGFSDQVMNSLLNYFWPGNVRELKHVVEDAYISCPGQTIDSDHLPPDISSGTARPVVPDTEQINKLVVHRNQSAQQNKDTEEAQKIISALIQTAGNKVKAAHLLGIDRSTLYRKMSQYNIQSPPKDI